MSSFRALVWALLIVAYFTATTVWLPDFVLGLESVQRMGRTSQDVVASAMWAGGLGVGMFGLRSLQRREVI